MKLAHVIEKGLALPESRLNFGEENIRQLAALLNQNLADRSTANVMALNALQAYVAFHESRSAEPLPLCRQVLENAEATAPIPQGKSLVSLSRAGIEALGSHAALLMQTRRSVRQFGAEPVQMEAVVEAIRLAQTAPSVCNRQAGRIHLIFDRDLMTKALKLQGGNRGFGETLGALAIVTCELGSFLEPNERNQAYVDGGLFGMAFLLGLHAQALGACPLNWSRNPLTDMDFRKLLPIPDSETIIMLVGIGTLRDDYVVAGSTRLPTETIYDVLTP